MSRLPTRVVKLGGSLLDRASLVGELRRWLRREPEARTLIVVGGGPMIDVVAHRQKAHGLGDAAAHWLCIRVMQTNAHLLAAAWGEAVLVDDVETWSADATSPTVLDPWSWMRSVDPQCVDGPLPESWDVSSDSIAARIATWLCADELVLLKSTLPADPSQPGDYVDPYFARASGSLARIRFVDLTDAGFREMRSR